MNSQPLVTVPFSKGFTEVKVVVECAHALEISVTTI